MSFLLDVANLSLPGPQPPAGPVPSPREETPTLRAEAGSLRSPPSPPPPTSCPLQLGLPKTQPRLTDPQTLHPPLNTETKSDTFTATPGPLPTKLLVHRQGGPPPPGSLPAARFSPSQHHPRSMCPCGPPEDPK